MLYRRLSSFFTNKSKLEAENLQVALEAMWAQDYKCPRIVALIGSIICTCVLLLTTIQQAAWDVATKMTGLLALLIRFNKNPN